MSDELKAQGNAAFAAKDFTKAAELFTQAIALSPENHVLYSNRSGAYASLKDWKKAIADAEKCVELNPQWAKGYTRLGSAYHGDGDLLKAYDSYEQCLKIDPNNAQAKSGAESVQASIQREATQDGQSPDMGMGKLFEDPQTWAKLQADPRTKEYLNDPQFVQQLKNFASNPMAALGGAAQDPRLMTAMGVILGIDMNPTADDVNLDTKTAPKQAESKPVPKPEPVDEGKVAADQEKALGNTAYKQRQFPEAIAHYEKAWDLYQDITYLNNKSAAQYEAGEFNAAIKTCESAIEEGKERHADYKLIAKAYGRIGTCYLKQDMLNEAIEFFEKSLTEHRAPDILTKLRSTQRELRLREEQAYLSPEKADEAREEGNALFKEGKFPESVKAYTEAVKRNPKDPRNFGNRAAAFLKLMSYPETVRDCDEAIKLDNTFFKAYSRKATALNIMKQFSEAMATMEAARKIDTEGKHSREIEEIYQKALNSRFAALPGETEEQRRERCTSDPEIQKIANDPAMQMILQQAVQNPAALRDHMRNPEVREKINLLAAAGVIGVR